jgi:hypothetical protein
LVVVGLVVWLVMRVVGVRRPGVVPGLGGGVRCNTAGRGAREDDHTGGRRYAVHRPANPAAR